MAAAGDLLFEPDPGRDRAAGRRRPSLDDVTLVAAELGTLAGAIGAAVHGAERRGAASADGGGDAGA